MCFLKGLGNDSYMDLNVHKLTNELDEGRLKLGGACSLEVLEG